MSIILDDHPKEAELVGRILTGYGDIEYLLTRCVGVVLGDNSAAVRCLFRLRGGDVRIQVTDAIARPAFDRIGLTQEYEIALGSLRYSTKIRNQYAHAHWMTVKGAGLYFTDMEKSARTHIGGVYFILRHIDAPLLGLQLSYSLNTMGWLSYIYREYEVRAGKSSSHAETIPQIIPQPPLHNPPEKHPIPHIDRGDAPLPEEPPPETPPV